MLRRSTDLCLRLQTASSPCMFTYQCSCPQTCLPLPAEELPLGFLVLCYNSSKMRVQHCIALSACASTCVHKHSVQCNVQVQTHKEAACTAAHVEHSQNHYQRPSVAAKPASLVACA